jgi:hypothetical protein
LRERQANIDEARASPASRIDLPDFSLPLTLEWGEAPITFKTSSGPNGKSEDHMRMTQSVDEDLIDETHRHAGAFAKPDGVP